MSGEANTVEQPISHPGTTANAATEKRKRMFTVTCYALVGVTILALFVENFIFSSDMGLLGFRAIDDDAFQHVLRRMHLAMYDGDFDSLWVSNDYAYGWIFWVPMALVTYPLYLVSTYWSVEWPLIVMPRQISLLFAVASLVVLRKILRKMEAPEWSCAAALLTFALYPTFGFFSLRFGTVNAVVFFSILSLYLAQRDDPSTARGRMLVAASLAASAGIKLSGLLIAPLVFAFILLRLPNRRPREVARAAVAPGLLFMLLLPIFANPKLLKIPLLGREPWDAYFRNLNYFVGVTKVRLGPADPFERFFVGSLETVLNAVVVMALALGLTIYAYKRKKLRRDILVIFATLLCVVAYLLVSVKNGASAGAYFTTVSFLLVLGVAGWARMRYGFLVLVAILALQLVDGGMRAANQWQASCGFVCWNHLFYFNQSVMSRKEIENAELVAECIKKAKTNPQMHIFVDYTVRVAVSPLSSRYRGTCISFAWNNLSAAGKYCQSPISHMVLDKQAPGALPQGEFDAMLRTSDPKVAKDLLTDRASRTELATSRMFANQRFEPICEYGRAQVLKALN
jgi:hypothetical protein